MLVRFMRALALVALIAAPLAGAAHAHEAAGDGLLPALPANAPPGDCYAHVRVSGPPAPPPATAGARWVLNPGPPGAPGPIWCLEPTLAFAPAPPPIEREGWIRVLCDRDATPDRISRVQRRLREHGLYRGAFTGRYDAETAAAVAQFQGEAHIAHGGYLSLETLDALEANAAYASGPPEYRPEYAHIPAPPPAQYAYSYDYGLQTAAGPPPCCVQPSPQAYAGYARPYPGPTPPYASRSAIQNGWLTWPGKSVFYP